MTEIQTNILDATIEVVSRYGMRKTSMGDIADKARVSRQTVYNLFGSKDDIYRAAILHMGELRERQARQRLSRVSGLDAELDILFDILGLQAYRFAHSNTDTEDMFIDAQFVAADALLQFYEVGRRLIAEVLMPYEAALSLRGISVDGFADQVELACRGFKRDARSLKHLKELLAIQKRVVLTMVGLDEQGSQ